MTRHREGIICGTELDWTRTLRDADKNCPYINSHSESRISPSQLKFFWINYRGQTCSRPGIIADLELKTYRYLPWLLRWIAAGQDVAMAGIHGGDGRYLWVKKLLLPCDVSAATQEVGLRKYRKLRTSAAKKLRERPIPQPEKISVRLPKFS